MAVLCLFEGTLGDDELEALGERLAAHGIELVVESRRRERRTRADRRIRASGVPPAAADRRQILGDRRVIERRAPLDPLERAELLELELLESALRSVRFVARVDPTPQTLLDARVSWLAVRAQGGDPSALSGLLEALHEPLYGRFRAATRSHEDAEDLVHDALVAVIGALPRFEFRTGVPFGRWVNTVASNLIVRWVGARRGRGELVDPAKLGGEGPPRLEPSVALSPFDLLGWISDADLLREVERLPERRRHVVELRFRLGLSVAQTAEALGVSERTVRNLQHRALATIRERLAPRRPSSRGERFGSRRSASTAPVVTARRWALRDSHGSAGTGPQVEP